MRIIPPDSEPARAWGAQPTPHRPRPLFTIDGVHYEAIRELERMQTGELLMLARRVPERWTSPPALFFVRRLANPSTTPRRLRLAEEIQRAFSLRHPAIGQVLHRKVHQKSLHVVMEYVDGPSLETLVSASVARGQPVSESFALYVGAELAEALHHAHTLTDDAGNPLGIIHRDVNPRHVHLGTHGEVKLMNFGAAFSLSLGCMESPNEIAWGDVAYVSPEYPNREALTPRSDVFSLGMLLVELFTSKHPLDLQDVPQRPRGLPSLQWALLPPLTRMEVQLARFGPPDVEAAVGRLSPDVKRLLHGALRARPEGRFTTAANLRDGLRTALASRHPGYGRLEAAGEVARLLAEGRVQRDVAGPGDDKEDPVEA